MSRLFNVRVYGLFIKDNKVLVSEEIHRGIKYIKFPGGGLEYGEGTVDALKREFIEELNLPIEIISHYYTTDFFQKSILNEEQIISIYYLINLDSNLLGFANDLCQKCYYIDINQEITDKLSLPIDKYVANMLNNRY